MNQSLLDEVTKHRKHIKHEIITYGLSELVNMYRADPPEVRIQPEWQRLFRWSREQQSAFIESLIIDVPIPPLFFYEADGGTWELLDGLQRFSTVLKFMSAEADVPREFQGAEKNDELWHADTANDITQPLQLTAGDYLSQLEGVSFARLPTSLKLNLKRARLQIYVLKRETDRMYKYEVFKRLNSGGSQLEEQELRNCTIRVLSDRLPDFVRELGACETFRAALNFTPERFAKAEGDELVLRFLTMKNYGTNFRHDVGPLLTRYMELVASDQVAFSYEQERDVFSRVWARILPVANEGKLFRFNRGMFAPTLYELVTLSIAHHIERAEAMSDADLAGSLARLIEQSLKEGLTGAGSNSKKKTLGRLNKAQQWIL